MPYSVLLFTLLASGGGDGEEDVRVGVRLQRLGGQCGDLVDDVFHLDREARGKGWFRVRRLHVPPVVLSRLEDRLAALAPRPQAHHPDSSRRRPAAVIAYGRLPGEGETALLAEEPGRYCHLACSLRWRVEPGRRPLAVRPCSFQDAAQCPRVQLQPAQRRTRLPVTCQHNQENITSYIS